MVKLVSFLVIVALGAALLAPAQADDTPAADWPDKVVTIEALRPVEPLRFRFPRDLTRGTVRGPATIRAHVDRGGEVVKAVLLDSCGNPDLDEAAIRGVRGARFEPYQADGAPSEVTLVLPVNVPKRLGRTR